MHLVHGLIQSIRSFMYTKTCLSFFKAKDPIQPLGHLYIISGPSGVGKTTIIENLLAKDNKIEKIVAFTTRPMRVGEISDKTYHYISREAFEEKMEHGDFLEYLEFSNHFYGFGLTKEEVLTKLRNGIDLIVDMDYSQVSDLKSKIPNCYSIFIVPPSLESLTTRLKSRGDSEETISKRMGYAKDIIEHQHVSDTIILNHDGKVEEAVAEIFGIIKSNRVNAPSNFVQSPLFH